MTNGRTRTPELPRFTAWMLRRCLPAERGDDVLDDVLEGAERRGSG